MFACARPLTRCLIPPPPSIFLDKEVAANEEGIDDDTDAAADAADAAPDDANDADADDYAADDIAAAAADATMLPKVKPLPTKPTKKDAAAAVAKPPPPATAAAAATTSFSIDANDPLTDNYYTVGVYDYADVVFRVNGTMQKGEYQVQVAEDGLSVLFVHAISLRSFDKKILRKIMGAEYRESSSRVVAWDDTALEMQVKNVRPVNGLFWGKPQVVRLRWKCTGTPTAVNKHDYPTDRVRDKRGEWHVQCDCIMIVTVRKAEERTQAELEVATSYVDLFGIDSSQESKRSDDPASPPPRRRKNRRSEARHAVDGDIDDDDDGGGKRGGGDGDGGGGKRKKGF